MRIQRGKRLVEHQKLGLVHKYARERHALLLAAGELRRVVPVSYTHLDVYKRQDINYLRLSITDRCNLRCRYCMPDGCDMVEHGDILSYEEFLRLARLFATLGVEHVRVTGCLLYTSSVSFLPAISSSAL